VGPTGYLGQIAKLGDQILPGCGGSIFVCGWPGPGAVIVNEIAVEPSGTAIIELLRFFAFGRVGSANGATLRGDRFELTSALGSPGATRSLRRRGGTS
jgi:hypothetical protein